MEFTLEILAHGPEQTQILPISIYVHKYTEFFRYSDYVPNINTPIAYYETPELDAWKNIQLVDQRHSIPENVIDFNAIGSSWIRILSTTFSSPYKTVAITNRVKIDEYGKEHPLFLKHVLPANTVEANLYMIEAGDKLDIDKGFLIDIDAGAIFTNYRNFYNPDTGAYRIYFVSSAQKDADGNFTSTNELLSPVPAIEMATWEDVDLDTGKIINTTYSVEASSSGYTFTIYDTTTLASTFCADSRSVNEDGTATWGYYAKPLEETNIKALLPSGKTPENPWHIKITNGEFYQLLRGRLRRYYIPEYDTQPFSPSKPFVYSPYRKMLWVNRNTLKMTREYIAVSPDDNREMVIYIYNEDEELIKVFATDVLLEGERYSDTKLFYETDKILSWDNRDGFIALGIDLNPNYTYYASFFYEAKEYEYTNLTLNPLQNQQALEFMWVYYVIPDAHLNDKAIHTLSVDSHGNIAYTSQSIGISYPNLQLLNADGSYNSNTIIGMKYSSMIESTNFRNLYTVPYINDYQYYVIAEAVVMDIGDEQDSIVFDARREGATIRPAYFEEAILANARILQSSLGYGQDGQIVPDSAAMIVNLPLSLLEDYGGEMTTTDAEDLVRKHLPAADHAVLNWTYPAPTLSVDSSVEETATLTMSWEGPSLTYNIYYRINPAAKWELLTSIENPTEGVVQYEHSGLVSEQVYYYGVRVVEDSVEFPFGNTLGAMIR